jgi:small subunit ribosomal protein S24e
MGKHVKLLDKYDGEVIEEKYNGIIERYEVKIRIMHFGEGTPSRGLLKTGIAKLYNKDPSLVFIRRAETRYGSPETIIEAHIYNSLNRAKLFEPEHLIKRDEESYKKITETQIQQ